MSRRLWSWVGGRSSSLDGPGAGDAQLSERFDGSGPGLGNAGGVTAEHRSGGGLGVDGVGLASTATFLAVGAVDLHDAHLALGEEAGQARAPRPGSLDADGVELAEGAQPAQQPPIAVAGGREAVGGEQAAELVERGGHVDVLVGVDASGHPARGDLCDGGHVTPLVDGDGTHRPGGRTGQ